MSIATDSNDLTSQLLEDSVASTDDRLASIDSDSTPPPIDATPLTPAPSYVKLAMRNMVRKRGLSLYHFMLTAFGLLAILVGLSYATR